MITDEQMQKVFQAAKITLEEEVVALEEQKWKLVKEIEALRMTIDKLNKIIDVQGEKE